MIIHDPINPDKVAIDEDGELLGPVRIIPLREDGQPPSVADFDGVAPIGWSKGIPFSAPEEDVNA